MPSRTYTPGAPDIRVTVKLSHCEAATARDQFNCAFVRAIQDKFPDALRVRVNSKSVAFTRTDEDLRYRYPTPQAVVERIIEPLDSGRDRPHPGTYLLSGGEACEANYHDEQREAWNRDARNKERAISQERRDQRPSVQLNKGKGSRANYLRYAPDQ